MLWVLIVAEQQRISGIVKHKGFDAMPNTRSAIKRLRTSKANHQRHMRRRARLMEAKKAFLKEVTAGNSDAARDALKTCYSLLDRAAKNHTISKNKASRDKSRLTARLNQVQ